MNRSFFSKGYSCRGASHILEDKPCQDAYSLRETETALVLAVSDGHGGESYDLSRYGAEIAVASALDAAESVSGKCSGEELYERVRADLPLEITSLWRSRVEADISEREPEFFAEKRGADKMPLVYERYGATLVVVILREDGIFCAQLGDGDILFLDEKGSVTRPITDFDEPMGVSTYSLVSSKSEQLWRFARFIPGSAPYMIFLSSDGLVNCFDYGTDEQAEDQFHRLPKSLFQKLKEAHQTDEMERVSSLLPDILERYTQDGSGDDITVLFSFAGGNDVK
ncbi:hypothetical protein FACS1894216_09350 [Synergistales bacterium]|nr:hypothetical protein FACS1894216_09350 [Synergistales bacterium]